MLLDRFFKVINPFSEDMVQMLAVSNLHKRGRRCRVLLVLLSAISLRKRCVDLTLVCSHVFV